MNGDLPPRIQSAAVRIILKVPEFAPLLSLPIREGEVEGGYAQVDEDLNILVSPSVPDNCLAGVLLHEFLHIVLQHFARARKLTPLHPHIFNVAADAVINTIVNALGFKLPEGCVNPDVVADFLGVRTEELVDLGTEEVYYRLLQKAQQQQRGKPSALNQKPHDNHQPFFQPKQSSSSKQRQQQQQSSSSTSQQQQSQQQLPQPTLPQSDQQSAQQSDQQQPLRPEDFATFAISVLPQILRQHGLSPVGVVRDYILSRYGTVDWRSLLYNVFASLQSRYIFPHRKLLPFRLSFPHQISDIPRLLIAVDASGSISHEELSRFLAEVDALQQQFPSLIHIISFDASVYPICELLPAQPIPEDIRIHGGGGTDFRPIADYAISQPNTYFDAVIVLTDGYGEYPSPEHPAFKDTKWVWVLTPNHQRPPAGLGEWAILEGGEV